MSPYVKFGFDRPSRSAGHRQQTNKQINRHITFYYVDIQNGDLPQNNDARARKIIFQAERYVWLEDRLWHLQLPWNRRKEQTESVTRQLAVPTCLN